MKGRPRRHRAQPRALCARQGRAGEGRAGLREEDCTEPYRGSDAPVLWTRPQRPARQHQPQGVPEVIAQGGVQGASRDCSRSPTQAQVRRDSQVGKIMPTPAHEIPAVKSQSAGDCQIQEDETTVGPDLVVCGARGPWQEQFL